MRSLLHLNPVEFSDNAEVLSEMPTLLAQWKSLLVIGGIRLLISSGSLRPQNGHQTKNIAVRVVNDTDQRITEYTGELGLPAEFLKHWGSRYPSEIRQNSVPNRRFFRFTQAQGVVEPRDKLLVWATDCCVTCALEEAAGSNADVSEAMIEAKLWVDGRS